MYSAEFHTEEELAECLKSTKKFIDRTHTEIKLSRYGKEQADRALLEFFSNYDIGNFPNTETRQNFEELTYHGNEIFQILSDFAISSYISDKQKGIPHHITSLDEVNAYHDPDNQNLNYDPQHVKEVVALLVAESSYFALNVLGYNKRLRRVLAESFVSERYGSLERRQELDNTPNTSTVKLASGEILTMSKTRLNRDIDNMIRDDDNGIGYFQPRKIVHAESQKTTTK